MEPAKARPAARHSFARTAEVLPMPNLNSIQLDSFDWFMKEGLKELFAEMSPVVDDNSEVK
jgi:DNA-directed RNA polymerase subunit beta